MTDQSGYNSGGDFTPGVHCEGQEGYDDIIAGAQVVVSDDAGRTLAITHLSPGKLNGNLECVFRFSGEVPAGHGFYGVAVSHRGVVKEAEADLSNLELSIG